MKFCFYLWLDQEWKFIKNYQNIPFQIYIMKFCFYLWPIDDGILLENIKNVFSNLCYEICFYLWLDQEILLKIIKIYHSKFILWNSAFIYGRIKKFYWKLLKYIIPNLYYEILLLSMTDQGWDFIRNY